MSGYYAILPSFVRYSTLSDGAKLLYAELTALTQSTGYCYASNKYIVGLLGMSRSKLQRLLRELEKAGYIECLYTYKGESKEIAQRRIFFRHVDNLPKNVDNSVDNSGGVVSNMTRGGVKYDTDNNINIIEEDSISNNIYQSTLPPTILEVYEYWYDKGYWASNIRKIEEYYSDSAWVTAEGEPILYWQSLIDKCEIQAERRQTHGLEADELDRLNSGKEWHRGVIEELIKEIKNGNTDNKCN